MCATLSSHTKSIYYWKKKLLKICFEKFTFWVIVHLTKLAACVSFRLKAATYTHAANIRNTHTFENFKYLNVDR